MTQQRMVFEDPSKRRWFWTLTVFGVVTLVVVALSALFLMEWFVDPPLPAVGGKLRRNTGAWARSDEPRPATGPKTNALRGTEGVSRTPAARTAGSGLSRLPHRQPWLVVAFLEQGDPQSVAAFETHAETIDVVIPDWFTLTGPTSEVKAAPDPGITRRLRQHAVAILPRVSNVAGDAWHTEEVEALLHSEPERLKAARRLADLVASLDVDGLNLDFEALKPEDNAYLLEFINDLANALHAKGKLLTVDVPPNDPAFDLEVIGRLADGVILMAYDEHFPGSPPGPIASESWFEDSVDTLAGAVPRDKLIVAMGNYGYDWTRGLRRPADVLTYSEVMAAAIDHAEAVPEMDPTSRNPRFEYRDDKGRIHEVWFLDMLTVWNQVRLAHTRRVAGLGLWRLGSEAPDTWRVLQGGLRDARELAVAAPLPVIQYLSEGELLRINSIPHPGRIELTLDHAAIEQARYVDIPSGYSVKRIGAEIPRHTLVLTFDDGPDPVWTPRLLATLERLQVPAAFFVVGDQAARYPGVVAEAARRQVLLGNHTYLHPNIARVSPARLRTELNLSQRLIEALTHKRTVLFRAPYDTDSTPSTPAQLDVLKDVTDLGYVIAAANIDSEDWTHPGVEAIVQNVKSGAANPANHVILLHDGGGDRSQTVAAVERFVPELQAKGYRFVSLSDACGIPADLLNPPLPPSEALFVAATSLWAKVARAGWSLIVALFVLTTALSLFRVLLLGSLVLTGTRSRVEPAPSKPSPFISIVIPVYNEETVIAKTIGSLRQSTHQDYEILVVNDGSTDGTADVVQALAASDPRIRLVTLPNGGKAQALNAGFRAARADIVVTIDGDTLLLPDTLRRLAAPFEDPHVEAVCGNVEVGNVHNLLTGFQALEYITTQNFDRRAFDRLNCITVVPGATGAWRRERILALGGYANDTLTEDADITLRVLRNGGKVVYEPEARSRTEAPDTVRGLARQRFRWSYGTFQCLWKHRDALFQGPLGWVGLPNMFLFQVLFPILSPIGDGVFLLALLRGDLRPILVGYVLFVLLDLAGSLLAFTLERKPRRLMWLILVQRFFYRQFMYVVTFRSLAECLHGRRHGWNKVRRAGSVPESTP